MKVLERKNENHQEIFKVELDKEETARALDTAYEHLVKEVNIDGFRKGKAPREVVESKIGKQAIFDQAMKDSLPDLVDSLLVENKVRAYATPEVKVTSQDPVIFETTVPLPPDITLGDYNAIKMKPNPIEIEDKAVEDILERARHQVADWESTGAPAEMKDMLVMDIHSEVEGTPYVVEDGANFQLQPGWRFPVPGFADKMVGAKAGDEKEFSINMPDTYPEKDKAGKPVNFKIKVHDVKREKLPELNDEFAAKVAPGSESIEKLREELRADLKRRAEENENKNFEEKVIDALVEKSQIAFPPLLIDSEVDRMLREYVDRVRNTTQNEEEFKAVLNMTSEDKLRETYRPQAEQRVKRNLVISRMADQEKVEASEEEIDMQIAVLTAAAGDKVKEQTTYLNQPENRDTLRYWLRANKTRQLLIDKAKAGESKTEKTKADKSKSNEPKAKKTKTGEPKVDESKPDEPKAEKA